MMIPVKNCADVDIRETAYRERVELIMRIMRYRQFATLAGRGEETRQWHIKASIEQMEQQLREIDERLS